MATIDFPPGKSLNSRTPGIPITPSAVKPISSKNLPQRRRDGSPQRMRNLPQRMRNLVQPVTNVFSSCAEKEVSGGVADLSAGSFWHNFSSWLTQT